MKIECIFESYLYAVIYDTEEKNEFERLFDLWNDAEYLEEFFNSNEDDLHRDFYNFVMVEEAIVLTIKEAQRLEDKFLELVEQSGIEKGSLNILFKPLDNNQFKSKDLIKSKGYGDRRKSWLRLYAIKMDASCFLVTGGAIKLTATMQERRHTQLELEKLERVRNILLQRGISDSEGFLEFEL